MLIRPVPSIVNPPTPIGVGGFRGADSLILDFYSGVLDPRVNYTGGANRTYLDSAGGLQDSSTNAARFTHLLSDGTPLGLSIWEARTNGIRYNTMGGAAPGTPGTPPTNWDISAPGTTLEILQITTINGIKIIDVKITGTPSSSPVIAFETSTGIDASTGQTWTTSVYLAVIAGDFTNLATAKLRQMERTEAGDAVSQNAGSDFKGSLTSTLQRFDYTVTLSGGGTVAHIRPQLFLGWSSGAIDITLRIGLPQEEQGTGASPVIKTTNAAVTATADQPTSSFIPNASEGTILVELTKDHWDEGTTIIMVNDGGTSTANLIRLKTKTNRATAPLIHSGGVPVFSQELSNAANNTDGQATKLAIAWAANDFIAVSGSISTADTTGNAPVTLSKFAIGMDRFGGNQVNGTIGFIEVWPYRIIDGTLQADLT